MSSFPEGVSIVKITHIPIEPTSNYEAEENDLIEGTQNSVPSFLKKLTQIRLDVLFMSMQLKKFLGHVKGNKFNQMEQMERKLLKPYFFKTEQEALGISITYQD